MALRNEAGTVVSKSTFESTTTTDQAQSPRHLVNEDVYEDFRYPGSRTWGRRLKYYAGQVISQEELDAAYEVPTISGIDPNTGPAAGGTEVTITGQNLYDVSAVNFGATPGTALTKNGDGQSLVVTTPAGAAGAVDVVLVHGAGNATETGGFTYV